eukprot:1361929-Amorphochlora_amoeboformis.AAC.1
MFNRKKRDMKTGKKGDLFDSIGVYACVVVAKMTSHQMYLTASLNFSFVYPLLSNNESYKSTE